MGLFFGRFSLRMGQFSNPVATHPRTNEVEVPPGALALAKLYLFSRVSAYVTTSHGIGNLSHNESHDAKLIFGTKIIIHVCCPCCSSDLNNIKIITIE